MTNFGTVLGICKCGEDLFLSIVKGTYNEIFEYDEKIMAWPDTQNVMSVTSTGNKKT